MFVLLWFVGCGRMLFWGDGLAVLDGFDGICLMPLWIAADIGFRRCCTRLKRMYWVANGDLNGVFVGLGLLV